MSDYDDTRLEKERKRWALRWKSKKYREYNKLKCKLWYAKNVDKKHEYYFEKCLKELGVNKV